MQVDGGGGRVFFGEFELDTARRALCRRAQDLRLAPKEFMVLACLVGQAGNAVARETLLAEVWPGTVVGDTSLARCISSLRKHLGAEAIEAVPKFGYRFALPVTAGLAHTAVMPAPKTTRDRRWWIGLAGVAIVLLVLGGGAGIWRRGFGGSRRRTGRIRRRG